MPLDLRSFRVFVDVGLACLCCTRSRVVSIGQRGETPLHVAARGGLSTTCEVLAAPRADPDATNQSSAERTDTHLTGPETPPRLCKEAVTHIPSHLLACPHLTTLKHVLDTINTACTNLQHAHTRALHSTFWHSACECACLSECVYAIRTLDASTHASTWKHFIPSSLPPWAPGRSHRSRHI